MTKLRGFGLIDVAISICVVALLASFVIPVYQAGENTVKYEESVMKLKSVADAMEKHYLETGIYPAFEDWSRLAVADNPLVSEEYLKEVPTKDAFGRFFLGKSDGSTYELQGMSIISFNAKLVSKYPDYSFKTGAKFQQKGKKDN